MEVVHTTASQQTTETAVSFTFWYAGIKEEWLLRTRLPLHSRYSRICKNKGGLADLKEIQEQRIASEEKSRCDIKKVFRGLHTRQAPATAYTPMYRFSTLKINADKFSGEPEDRKTCSRVH